MKPEKCPNCNSTTFVQNGKRGNKQRYLCKQCNYRFTGETILRKKDRYFEVKALQLWLEGLTFKAIGHLLGFSDDTIGKWLKPYTKKLEPLQLDRRKLTGKIKQYEKVILIKEVNAHSSAIVVNGFESHVFGISRKQNGK